VCPSWSAGSGTPILSLSALFEVPHRVELDMTFSASKPAILCVSTPVEFNMTAHEPIDLMAHLD
jgi:hypothetical protein